jgi:hypothetical protein
MPKARSGPPAADHENIDSEIARLRDLDLEGLQAFWRITFRRDAPSHLPRHLVFAIIAYRLQADVMGDLDAETLRFLKRVNQAGSIQAVAPLTQRFEQKRRELSAGTVLTREWNGRHHRVMVLEQGFAWEGRTYKSLSEIAKTITGTKWNGPRFFGLRDQKQAEAAE